MAKALMGHVGYAPDIRMASELRRLREQVRQLEEDNDRLRASNAALSIELGDMQDMQLHASGIHVPDDIVAIDAEPALT